MPNHAAMNMKPPSPASSEVLADVTAAGLRYVSDNEPGLRRRRKGDGFCYIHEIDGARVRDAAMLQRIRALAIPPAWDDVWICMRPEGHVQATGRDARGRKQYRYHPDFREVRESTKYEHMAAFARALPAIRARVASDMARSNLTREKVLATVVHLLETTLIRVGNDEYAKNNRSYGLTTLRSPHVQVNGTELRFSFKGKSGKTWRLQVKDRRVAKIIRSCQELPGQHLFQYIDEAGALQDVASSDVNNYLRDITGGDVSAKDFRTWGGTVLAAMALRELAAIDGGTKTKKNVRAAIERVAARLGNTVTICRKCYVHPEIVTGYLTGALTDALAPDAIEAHKPMKGLTPEESAVLRLLEKRSKPTGQFAFAAKSLARSDPSRSQSRVRRPRK